MILKRILLICSLVIVLFISAYLIYDYNSPRNNTTIVYYVPSDLEGKCYYIYYNQEGEPPLIPEKVKGKYELTIKYPSDGKLLTSSDGETIPELGRYKVKAFSINEDGVVIEEISNGDISGSLTDSNTSNAYSTNVFDGSGYCH